MDELLIRPAASSEADELTQLVMRSKAHWGYSEEFLRQAAGELTVSGEDIARGRVSVAEIHGRAVRVSALDLSGTRRS